MYTARLLAVAAAVLLSSSATAVDSIPRPPKFDYTMETLENGLQVVYLEDHSTPIVHLALWYHVGSKNEKPGRTGFAHLFEHLMFKGSKNVRADQHPSWITSVGGQSNAFTDEDATVFWETVPAQYLPLVLWLEADRMATLEVDEAKFLNEREVVKEERRMRYENQPFGRLSEIIFDKAFTVHPVQAPDDWEHGRSRGRLDLRRSRVPRDVLRAEQRDTDARRRLRHRPGQGARQPVHGPGSPREAGAARHSAGAGAGRRNTLRGERAVAAAGRGGLAPHHVRRAPGRLPAAHPGEDPVRRRKLADLPVARVREAAGAGRVRRSQAHRASESLLCRRHRAARAGSRPTCNGRCRPSSTASRPMA